MSTVVTSTLAQARHSRAALLSVGVVCLCLSVVLLGDVFNLRDDGSGAHQTARSVVAEAMSIQLSTLASTGDEQAVRDALTRWVDTQPIILSVRLARQNDTESRWFDRYSGSDKRDRLLEDDGVMITVFKAQRPWAEVTVWFTTPASFVGDFLYYGFVALSLLVSQLAYLSKVLVQLDPSKAIPERVNSAFNVLTEGVVVLDLQCRILMVNTAAVAIVGRQQEQLVGKPMDSLPWIRDEQWQSPWATAVNTGLNNTRANLKIKANEPRSFTVSCVLIRNDDNKLGGVMVTLDDITAIERKNKELSGTLHRLRKSQESIQKKNRELETLALQDPLTGLNNRRALLSVMEQELLNAQLEHTLVACVMVDIDHFKSINDNHGHAIGDEVICAVANTLTLHTSSLGTAGRVGGEEFVIVLPGVDRRGAEEIAEKLRHAIEQLANDVTLPVDKLSASLGVSSNNNSESTVERMLDQADQALYQAKRTGRNRVLSYDLAMAAIEAGTDHTPHESSSNPVADANHTEAQVIELRRRLEEQSSDIERLRDFDALTGVPKREVFVERLAHQMETAHQLDQQLAVLSISPRGLSTYEASLSHEENSQLVKGFATRLREGLRRTDCVAEIATDCHLARISDGVFCIILGNIASTDSVLAVVTRIRSLMSMPLMVGDTSIHAGCTIGASIFPANGVSAEPLLDKAIAAHANASKEAGKSAFSFATDQMNVHSRQALEIESDLYEAVYGGQLSLNYQPKLDLASQRVESLEALVRWQHPTKDWISPAEFIPVAEANGLITDISAFVMKAGFTQLKAWHNAGFRPLRLSVNISAAQLRDPDLASTVLEAIHSAGLAPEDIDVELTETSVIESPQRARVALGQLQQAGVAISMDDFGTGYTSLALLADLPLDSVKIDRSFVDAMETNQRSRAIVESIINMAHTLRLSVVGEGVETNDQLTTLAELGCNEIQGYLISRPLTAEDLTHFLREQAHRGVRKRA